MTTPLNPGGFLGNLLGGAMGTLAGANPLQQSLDQLTNAVNTLSARIAGGGTLGGGGGFPQVNSPGVNRSPGIGGGGPGGTGNVRAPQPFGRGIATVAGGFALGSAFAGYGQQQMPFQLGLNAYATMSMMGMSGAGMGNYKPTFNQLGAQVVNPISNSSMDALALAQQLQFLGGSPSIGGTALGRSGFTAAAAFGMTNPTLSGAASGSLAQQIYNPMLSMRMRLLGYSSTPRVMGSGMPQSVGNIASSLIQSWYGKNKVNPAQLYRTLSMGGKGFTNLEYLGLNPNQMSPLLEGFNKLFNAGYSPQASSDLFAKAASRNTMISSVAQRQLTRAGVTTVSSDIQKLRNNQSLQTQRNVDVADSFNSALSLATSGLEKWNASLNWLVQHTPLGGIMGGAGGLAGVLSGTNHGNSLLGLGGTALMLRGLGLGGAGGILGRGGAAAGGMLGRIGLGGLGAGVLPAGAAAMFASQYHFGNQTLWQRGNPGSGGHQTGWNSWSGLGNNVGNWYHDVLSTFGGGAIPTSSQQSTPGGKQASSSGGSGAAGRAISAAESQLGVPYVWGGEQPGVGFDCSGLIEWAYKQAGVNLPRTSQQQWSFLKNKSVPTNQVMPGDLVFTAGSDGTPNSPGHVGMMVTRNSLIEAPTTGQDVKIIGYNAKEWTHAARPTGSGSFGAIPGNNTGTSSLTGLYGNAGMNMGVGNYGSSEEVDLVSAMGGFGGGAPNLPFGSGNLSMPNRNGSGSGGINVSGRNAKAAQAMAKAMMSGYGWTSTTQWNDLVNLWNRESGWRWNATNPTSGAYGIPQSLPADKMASSGSDWRTNPATQIKWGLKYIKQRYGSPAGAWGHETSVGWYGGGGITQPGIEIVGDRGPEIRLTGGGDGILSNAKSMALLKAVSNQPAQSPWQNLSNQMNYQGQMITPGVTGTPNVVVNFGQNSIHINVPAGSDSSSSGREIARQVVKHIHDEDLWTTIARGEKN